MCRFQRAFLIFLALWLPLQAAAAAALPLCRHTVDHTLATAQGEALHEPGHCPTSAAAEPAVTPEAESSCDHCEACRLASASYLPAAAARLPLLSDQSLASRPLLTPPSHIGDPPQQPPRHIN
jgi:hypothetical protein